MQPVYIVRIYIFLVYRVYVGGIYSAVEPGFAKFVDHRAEASHRSIHKRTHSKPILVEDVPGGRGVVSSLDREGLATDGSTERHCATLGGSAHEPAIRDHDASLKRLGNF